MGPSLLVITISRCGKLIHVPKKQNLIRLYILYVAHGTSPPKMSKQVQIGEWKVQITWDGWLPCIPTIFYILNKSGLLISLQAYSFFFNMTLQAYSTMRNITPTAHILFTPSCHHAWLNCKVQVLILQLTNYLIIS
jgi:hypothetical protein